MQKIDVELVDDPSPRAVELGRVDRWLLQATTADGEKIRLCPVDLTTAGRLGLTPPVPRTSVVVSLTQAQIEDLEKGRVPDGLGDEIRDRLEERKKMSDDGIGDGIDPIDPVPIDPVPIDPTTPLDPKKP